MLQFQVEIFFQIGEEGRVVGVESYLEAVEQSENLSFFFWKIFPKTFLFQILILLVVLKSKSSILWVWVPRALDDFREWRIAEPDGF